MIIENTWTVAPIAMIDVPMKAKGMELKDEEGNVTGYKTIREYCADTTAQWRESNDARYILFGYEFSDLENDFGVAKGFAQEVGMTLAGKDFTQTGDNLVWLLSYSEVKEFLAVNPMFRSEDEVV